MFFFPVQVLIPALKQIMDKSSDLGVDSFIMGMPHRWVSISSLSLSLSLSSSLPPSLSWGLWCSYCAEV